MENTDLVDAQVVLQIDTENNRNRKINDVGESDMKSVGHETDCVLLLQSSKVMLEPRCLAKLFVDDRHSSVHCAPATRAHSLGLAAGAFARRHSGVVDLPFEHYEKLGVILSLFPNASAVFRYSKGRRGMHSKTLGGARANQEQTNTHNDKVASAAKSIKRQSILFKKKQRVKTVIELARHSSANTLSKANQDWQRHHPDGRYLSQ